MRQGVNVRDNIVAASWVDAAIVKIISNADDSSVSTVQRRIRQEKTTFKTPKCVVEYNAGMQGVDRLDQLRARFSIADGHSFKKWHRKLAMAFIDIARCNGYITRKLVLGQNGARDMHRDYMEELTMQLLTGEWKNSIGDDGMLFDNPDVAQEPATPSKISRALNPPTPTQQCVAQNSSQVIQSRPKRQCIVCRFENRYPTEVTNYCKTHKVSLCMKMYPRDNSITYACEDFSLNCWEKFHQFYLPRGVFNSNGKLRRGSELAKEKKAFDAAHELSSTRTS
jgi:hypothetical protein